MNTYDMADTARILEAARGSRMFTPVLLALLCGLRRGEIAALRWRSVDLEAAQLSVVESAEQTRTGVRYKAPKSGRGRSVALPSTVVEELRSHRVMQVQELLRCGVRATDDTFVVSQPDGAGLQPGYITHAWIKLIRPSGIPTLRFHDLRHAHATHLLARGVHPKVASERLGHSSVAITLDLYSHVPPGIQADTAALVDAAFREATEANPSATTLSTVAAAITPDAQKNGSKMVAYRANGGERKLTKAAEKALRHKPLGLVQLGGLEPPTSGSTDRRSNQLSYSCTADAA